MTYESLYDALDRCVDMMRQGASIDECLRRYPQYADALRPQLEAARTLGVAQPRAQADAAAEARGRARLLGAVADARRLPPVAEPTMGFVPPLRALFSRFGRLAVVPYALPAVMAMLLLGGAAFGVAAATGNSGPGNIFSGSRSDRIEIRGVLAAIDAGSLTVTTGAGDITVLITPETKFEDQNEANLTPADFVVGAEVKVKALRDGNGDLVAREVELEEEDDPDEDATPIASPEATPDDDADDNSGPGPNSGPGNAEDPDDNSGPGNGDEVDDNSGPGNGDEVDDDNSGPSSGEPDGAEDDRSGSGGGDEATDDSSGPGSGDSPPDD